MRAFRAGSIVLLVLVAACSGGSSDTGSGADGKQTNTSTYESAVETIDAALAAELAGVNESLEQTYETRDRLFAVLEAAEFPAELRAASDRLDLADPPAELEADHALLDDTLTALLSLEEATDDAVAQRDLATVAVNNAEAFVLVETLFAGLSPAYCSLLDDVRASAEAECGDNDAGGGGSGYGGALTAEWRTFAAEFGPRVSGAPTALDDEEQLAYFAALQPAVESAIKDARSEIAALDPPDELADDHEILLTYLDDTLALAEQITAAVESGDSEALPSLFDQSGTIVDRTAAALSDDMTALVGFFFAPSN